MIKNKNTIMTPMIPKNEPPSMNNMRYHLSPFVSSGSVKGREQMAVMAIIIIMMGDTMPALTAASPRIRAPTIDRALPPLGFLKSLSLNISKEVIMMKASKKAGKGTPSL